MPHGGYESVWESMRYRAKPATSWYPLPPPLQHTVYPCRPENRDFGDNLEILRVFIRVPDA